MFAVVLMENQIPHRRQSIFRNAHRIRPHIGNERDRALVTQLHSLVKALGEHHGLLSRESQLIDSFLLELGGRKGRKWIAPSIFPGIRSHTPCRTLTLRDHALRFSLT